MASVGSHAAPFFRDCGKLFFQNGSDLTITVESDRGLHQAIICGNLPTNVRLPHLDQIME